MIANINLESEIEDFKDRCKAWFAKPVDANNAGTFRDLIALGGDIEKKIETRRKAQKQPHMDAGKAVDDAHKPLAEVVTKGREHLKKMLTAFMVGEESRRREEAARLAREAEEARKAAEIASVRAPDPFAQFEAVEAQEAAQVAQEATSERMRVASNEGTSRVASLRTYWLVEVTDGPALVRHFAESRTLIDEAQRMAAAQVRAAHGAPCGIPGIKIIEDKRVA